MRKRQAILSVAAIAVLVAFWQTAALAGESTDRSKVDAARQQEYATIFQSQSPSWDWRTQVGGGTSAEVVRILTTYGNGDQLAEIQYPGASTLYKVLIHLSGFVTVTGQAPDGTGLDGKPICECAPDLCQEVAQPSEGAVKCHAIVQQNPQDGKKYVVCWADDPVCEDL